MGNYNITEIWIYCLKLKYEKLEQLLLVFFYTYLCWFLSIVPALIDQLWDWIHCIHFQKEILFLEKKKFNHYK